MALKSFRQESVSVKNTHTETRTVSSSAPRRSTCKGRIDYSSPWCIIENTESPWWYPWCTILSGRLLLMVIYSSFCASHRRCTPHGTQPRDATYYRIISNYRPRYMISTPTKLYLIVVQVYHYCRIMFNEDPESSECIQSNCCPEMTEVHCSSDVYFSTKTELIFIEPSV